jgi:predicted signal transduction protein with EAL and GGDEF domain
VDTNGPDHYQAESANMTEQLYDYTDLILYHANQHGKRGYNDKRLLDKMQSQERNENKYNQQKHISQSKRMARLTVKPLDY